MDVTDWFLTAAERKNDATILDRRHVSGAAWTSGNEVTPLVHGKTYFAELVTLPGTRRPGRPGHVR